MRKRHFEKIEDRLDFIEFRQQLLFDNDDVSRLLFEYEITEKEYVGLMNLMDDYSLDINDKKPVHHTTFEKKVYEIVPERNGDYHFCEYLTLSFYQVHRWEEVFLTLYGDSKKYSYLMKDKLPWD